MSNLAHDENEQKSPEPLRAVSRRRGSPLPTILGAIIGCGIGYCIYWYVVQSKAKPRLSFHPPPKALTVPTPLSKPLVEGKFVVIGHSQEWGEFHWNKSVADHPLTIRGKRFGSGIGTHANAATRLKLDGKFTLLSGMVGVDDDADGWGNVIFKVTNGSKVLFQSPTMTGKDAAKSFSVRVAGLSTVDLIVEAVGTGNGGDHADWVDLDLK